MGDLEVLQHRNSAPPSSRHHLYSNQTPPSARKSFNVNNNNNNNNNNINTSNKNYTEETNMFVGLSRRSCLLAPDSNRVVRVRKTVVFADARGLALTQVRIMSEPSEVPPFWSHRFLSHLIPSRLYDEVDSGCYSNENHLQTVRDTWHTKFEQPARDYVAFRKKLDDLNVALENVVITQKDERKRYGSGGSENSGAVIAVGTIKVKNLDYHKDVVVRYSMDGWKTYKDETCSHVPTSTSAKTGPSSSAYHLHDTFRFELSLPTTTTNHRNNPPPSTTPDIKIKQIVGNGILKNKTTTTTGNNNTNDSIINHPVKGEETARSESVKPETTIFCDRVEFCLRFRCAGTEHWDNNAGRNYAILRRQHNVMTKNENGGKAVAAAGVEYREAPTYTSGSAWSEFASWQHLENNCPYW